MTVVWLRCYPKQHVLAYLFGVSESSGSRILNRILPLLEQSGRDTMRLPDPSRKRRRELDELLKATPELAVIIDSFEQRVQRPLEASGLLNRLPTGIGALGDLAYLGIDKLHPTGAAASPRSKPKGQHRPPADIAFNQAFSRRIKVEHSIGFARRFESITQMDRHHRRNHGARIAAVCGLAYRHRFVARA